MLLRDLCEYFPQTLQQPLKVYLPSLAKLTTMMKSYYGCRLVDVWCIIEAAFYIYCKLKIRYLQAKDPLEACLSAAPMLDPEERKALWEHIMAVESEPSWIEEWFLDRPPIGSISLYDIYDFVCWAMFDGRNQEHLTTHELNDLEGFVEDLEYKISVELYGVVVDDEEVIEDTMTIGENDKGILDVAAEDKSARDRDLTMNRNRTMSDTATAADDDNFESYTYDLNSIDETGYGSPIKFKKRNHHHHPESGETQKSLKSGSWSSMGSIERPRPKKCEWHLLN